VLLLALLAGVGCGKAVDSTPGSVDAGGDDGDDTSDDTGDDTGDIDGSPDDGDEVDAAVDDQTVGRIVVFTRNYTDELGGENPLDSTVTAAFGDFATESCVEELAEEYCRVLACTPRAPAATRPDAGEIAIAGVQETVIAPQPSGVYEDLFVDQTLLSDGGNLTVSASGGEIEAFDIVDLVVPFSAGFQPGTAPTAASSVPVSAGDGWSLVWGGIEASDTFRITLGATAPDDDGATRRIECSLDAGFGGVTISPDALNLLPQGELAFEAVNERTIKSKVGDYAIDLVARVVNRNGDDATADWARGAVILGP
jgi:hypothetical protein